MVLSQVKAFELYFHFLLDYKNINLLILPALNGLGRELNELKSMKALLFITIMTKMENMRKESMNRKQHNVNISMIQNLVTV